MQPTYIQTVFAPYTGTREYTYKTTDNVKVGDYFTVQTPNGALQIVKVKTVDVPEPPYACKWAFQKIDLSLLEELKASEEPVTKKATRL